MHGFPASASHLHLCVLSDPHSVPISRSGAHAFFSSFQSLFAEPRSTKKSSHLNRCLRVLHGIPNMAGLCNPPPPPGCAFKIKLSPCRTESKKKEQVWLPSCLGVWLASICYFFHAVGMWMSQIWEIPSRWVVGMVGICVGPPSVWDHITMSDTAFVLVICQWENSLHSFFFYYFFF